MIEWYLNLTFLQAVLVWLKLLLPVLFILTVCALVGFSLKLFHAAESAKIAQQYSAQTRQAAC